MFGQSEKEEAEIDRVLGLVDQPVDINTARKLIVEIKKIMDENNTPFFLRQGTVLGAIRDGDLIPWDDDIDLGSIYGLDGFGEQQIETMIPAMQKAGYLVRINPNDFFKCVVFIKGNMRIDWGCYWVIDDSVLMYPAIPIPMRFFKSMEEIELLGQKYFVPSPPEEYLDYKYGKDWRIPKRAGEYEGTVLDIIQEKRPIRPVSKFKQFLNKIIPPKLTTILVKDQEGKPVNEANLFIAGLGVYKTDDGVFSINIPQSGNYALRFTVDGADHILYVEWVHPNTSYDYQLSGEHLVMNNPG